MAPRLATRPTRENDFSDVGKVGRRTGVTLPQGRLDVNGMEEISGIFSSPRKPSPLRKSLSAANTVEDHIERERDSARTPTTSKKGVGKTSTPSHLHSLRANIPPPRSASPRKSGIGGTARRSRTVDILGQNKDKVTIGDNIVQTDSHPTLTPSLRSSAARRFSPAKTPRRDDSTPPSPALRSRISAKSPTHQEVGVAESVLEPSLYVEDETRTPQVVPSPSLPENDYFVPANQDEEAEHVEYLPTPITQAENGEVVEFDEPPLPPPFDDEEADQTFEPEARSKPRSREPAAANSRRKRKSDILDQEAEMEITSSPAAKRAKRISDQSEKQTSKKKTRKVASPRTTASKPSGRPPLKAKDENTKISNQQKKELDDIVEKVKSRPGQKKSLYILRRETPADDAVTHTRSGRVSVKPLAYWRNERCVFGGSPGGASLQDGARFPLNSIKEIIRTEEVNGPTAKKLKKKGKGKRKTAAKMLPMIAENDDAVQDDQAPDDSAQGSDEEYEDPEAEPWETEKGTFRGTVAVFDPQSQAPTDEEEDMDLAYAPAAIETREVKGSSFRYAKLISLKFFGSGIVDLPPNSTKKAKNSRMMHMSFFVATGRVTVIIGPFGGPENRFSIGKGGWWQVPRGNQYAIENNHPKPARIFFSQACEPAPVDDDE